VVCDGEGVGVGWPARNGVLPADGDVTGVTGGGDAVGRGGGVVVRVGWGELEGEGECDGCGEGECDGGGGDCVGFGAGFTTMAPRALPAAPLAVTGWVLPAGPAM
jgi:hypothetical protein